MNLKLATWLLYGVFGAIILPDNVLSAGFSAAASPSRFELEGSAGKVVSRAFEVQHVGKSETEYVIRSADWHLSEENGLEFFDKLQSESCRPWLRLERRKIRMAPGQRRRVRFELHVPAEAQPMECRLAIMVENYEQQAVPLVPNSPIRLPLSGRLGIIVYLAVGDVRPQLELLGLETAEEAGRKLPMLRIRNTGSAHGRLDGAVLGTDAGGTDYRFPVSTLPIMPGQERRLPLYPQTGNVNNARKPPPLKWPVSLQGQLQWDLGNFKIESRLQ